MKVIIVSQARTSSTRLPKKVLIKILDKTLLEIHLERILKTTTFSKVIVATTTNKVDDVICEIANKLNVDCYRGDENDVLDRFYQAVKPHQPDLVVRLTSDCPLIDPQLIDEIISKASNYNLDYYSNVLEEDFPDGQDIEVFKFSALEYAWKNAKLNSEREHVTPYIRKNSSYNNGKLFKSDNHSIDGNYKNIRLTVDEPEDLEVMKLIINKLGLKEDWKTYADFYKLNKDISKINKAFSRNEGYNKSIREDKKN